MAAKMAESHIIWDRLVFFVTLFVFFLSSKPVDFQNTTIETTT